MSLEYSRDTPFTDLLGKLKRWISIGPILVLAAVLFFYQLGEESLWIDEFYSIADARTSTVSLLTSARPLYFLLLKVWMLFGTSETWLRALNIPFGLGTIFFIYLLGRRVGGETVGLFAALLMAVSPLFINHVQEVRMYALSLFLSVASTLALTYALGKPTSLFVGLWAVGRLLSILTTPLNLLLIFTDAFLIAFKFHSSKRHLFLFSLWFFLMALLAIPAIFNLVRMAHFSLDGWLSLNLKPGLGTILNQFSQMTVWTHRAFPQPIFYNLMLLGLLGMTFLRHSRRKALRVVSWYFLPIVVFLCVCFSYRPIWIPRYLLMVAPYLLILLALGFIEVWRKVKIVAMMIAIVYAVTLGGALKQYYTTTHRQDWRGVFQFIRANEKTGDALVLYTIYQRPQVILSQYYCGSAPVYYIPKKPQTSIAPIAWPSLPSRFWIIAHNYPEKTKAQDIYFRESINKNFLVQSHRKFFGDFEVFLVSSKP